MVVDCPDDYQHLYRKLRLQGKGGRTVLYLCFDLSGGNTCQNRGTYPRFQTFAGIRNDRKKYKWSGKLAENDSGYTINSQNIVKNSETHNRIDIDCEFFVNLFVILQAEIKRLRHGIPKRYHRR